MLWGIRFRAQVSPVIVMMGTWVEKADLLVFGSRGLGVMKGLLPGSVSSQPSQLAPCSCLVVR